MRHPRRDELKEYLDDNGVGCALHYPMPLHLQKCYANLGHKPGDFPVAEKAARECLEPADFSRIDRRANPAGGRSHQGFLPQVIRRNFSAIGQRKKCA